MVIHIRRKEIVLVNVTYYRPDFRSILQEFLWQTEDFVPEIPRVHKYLNHWKNNIDAVIKEVHVSIGNESHCRVTDFFKDL